MANPAPVHLLPVPFLLCLLLPPRAAIAQEHCMAEVITRRHLMATHGTDDLASALRAVPHGTARTTASTVPVVVHVVWNTAAENVPDAAITQMVAQMDQDYQQANADLATVRPAFTGAIGNAGVRFCLATVDPNGAPTNGITRTHTTETWFDPDTETDDMKSPPKGISPWDPHHYLNIWVCDITSGATGGTVTVGYAYLPVGGVAGSGIDGLVVDYDYGLATGDRTATHEVGHYFGLLHPFDNGNCTDSDGFSDTPLTNSPTFSCANPNLQKCGTLTQYENFMDYATCCVMFTAQQAAYMQGVLNGVRASLLNSPGCGTGPSGPCIPTSANGTSEGDFIQSVQLGSIQNIGTGGTGMPAYSDYSSQFSTDLARGNSYTLDVTGGTYVPDRYAAWIDWDQDGLFAPGEKIGEVNNSGMLQTMPLPFTVPHGAALGGTRMRVRGVYVNTGEPDPVDPCYDHAWGETEDYTVQVTLSTGLWAAGETSQAQVCVQGGQTLLLFSGPLTGQRYQVMDVLGRVVGGGRIAAERTAILPSGTPAGSYQVMVLGPSAGPAVLRFALPGEQ